MELKKGTMHESMGLSIAKERLQIVNMLNKAKTSINLIDKTDTTVRLPVLLLNYSCL